ncbi:MAG: flagellar motor switch protein FliN [Alphaproteobacteria bacterium]|nr:flagellar motor switch protein FliN [Alphaproteobacteria bacterium]
MDDTESIDFENLEDGAAEAPTPAETPPDDAEFEPVAAPQPEPSVDEEHTASVAGLEAIYDIPVQISAVLGKSTMQVSQLLKLGRGAVVELDRKVGEAIDIYVNDRLVARGEVVVVNERLGVTMTEIIKSD